VSVDGSAIQLVAQKDKLKKVKTNIV